MVRQLRILSISQYGADLAKGSAFSGALERQRDYARLVCNYTVLVPGAKDSVALQEDALTIRTVGATHTLWFLFRAYGAAVRLHRAQKFDVLMVDTPHLSGLLGVVLAARLGLPLVVHAMADMIENPWYARERQSNVLKIALMSLVVRFATVIRVSTQSEVARLISHGIKPERIAFIPFYIDQQQFIESLTTMSDVRKPRTALCVGRLELQKDMPTLIRAWSYVVKEVPDARLRIVGTGALESSLRALTAELSLTSSVDFLGALPRAQIAAEFTKAHVFVLTSLYEGTCMVLHEAALARLPIVSTEHAGAKDFVRDGENGYAVHIRDHRGIARALIMLFRDEALAHTMGEKSRAYARACTKEQALTSYETLLDRFVLPV